MISLKGRRPAEPTGFKTARKATVISLSIKAKATAIFKENDFPNHWGAHKYRFIRAQYNGKCAYCETDVVSGTAGDVEHFRPKAYCQALSSAKNSDDYAGQAPGRKNSGPATEGYWWLAYSWRNYLLSCNRCNSTWKKNQFPVGAKRATRGGSLASEKALLLNPFQADPEKHFEFNAFTGQIRGVTPQGVTTIEVCGLDRKSLDAQRQTKGARLNARYRDYVVACNEANDLAQTIALRALMHECRSKAVFAALARYFVKQHVNLTYRELLMMRRSGLL